MKMDAPNEERADRDHVATVLRLANERGDFVQGDDGYTYYWPTNEASRGALPAWALRVLADEMDKRDKAWHAVISGDPAIGPGCVQIWRWREAPDEWKKLSTHGLNEQWVALVPEALLDVGNERFPLDWMNWYPGAHIMKVQRCKIGAPHGFEIWIGATI